MLSFRALRYHCVLIVQRQHVRAVSFPKRYRWNQKRQKVKKRIKKEEQCWEMHKGSKVKKEVLCCCYCFTWKKGMGEGGLCICMCMCWRGGGGRGRSESMCDKLFWVWQYMSKCVSTCVHGHVYLCVSGTDRWKQLLCTDVCVCVCACVHVYVLLVLL